MNSFITHIALSAIVATMSVGTMSAYDAMYIAGNAIDGTWNLSSCAIKMAAPGGENAVYLWAGRLRVGEVKFLHDTADWGNSIVASEQYVTNPELGKDQVRLAYVLCKDDLRRAIMILEKALEAYNNR